MKSLLKIVLLTVLLTCGLPRPAAAGVERTWEVSPKGALTTIPAALAVAAPGDTIRVLGGIHPGNLVIDKRVHLAGEDGAVLQGDGQGTVVTLTGAGTELRGFTIRGSGVEPDRDHAGVTVEAPDVLVADNNLEDVLFGIFLARADRAVVRNNRVSSKAEYDIARKGDAIRVWYSQDVLVEGNRIQQARDVVAWYSNRVTFRDNEIVGGRYGIHLMYCDGAEIKANRLYANSVGIYTMYSRQVLLSQNDIRQQRGPSGYALGFKDSDDVLAQENLLVDNRAGVFLDGTPYRPGSYARFEDNTLAFNDIGVLLMSASTGANLRDNTFWENVQQVALQGSGKAGANLWQGNYWSDYSGYDADGDGFGDVPYRSERFFEGLTDREPRLRAMIYSPAAQAIEFAASSFPIIKPQPKFEDPAPASAPRRLPVWAQPADDPGASAGLRGIGVALLLAAGAIITSSRQGDRSMKHTPRQDAGLPADVDSGPAAPLVQAIGATKRYGRTTVLREVNLALLPGEAVALWGANGAGKTTLIKALLGLLDFEGQIWVAGQDARRQGKQARQHIGYVPQEAIFYDMTVQATMAFYARLKGVSTRRIPELLEKLGLQAHHRKPVPALSGGLKQRLALAVALLADPPLLLLDEPTANLDSQARQDYLALLKQLRREGKTILFASHRIEEVEALADRVIVLESGAVVQELSAGSVRLQLAPRASLALWVDETQRSQALQALDTMGWPARLNGRGSVVVEVDTAQKLAALQGLAEQGIQIIDFEIEGVGTWN